MKNKGTHRLILLTIIVLSFIYFILGVLYGEPHTADSTEYTYQAHNISQHYTSYCDAYQKPLNPSYYTLRPPGYSVFIAIVNFISQHIRFLLFIQTLLCIISLYIAYQLTQASEKINSKVWLLFLVLFPSQFILHQMVMSEALMQVVLITSIYCILQFILQKKIKYWAYANCLLSITLLIKPVLIYFWLPMFIFSAIIYWKLLPDWKVIAWSSLLGITALGWSTRNYYHTGYFHFSSIKSFYLLTCPVYALIQNEKGIIAADSVRYTLQAQAAQLHDFKTSDAYLLNQCYAIINTYKKQFMIYQIKGMINFFIDPGRTDMMHFIPMNDQQQEGFIHLYKTKGIEGIFNYFKNINPIVFILLFLTTIASIVLTILFLLWILYGDMHWLFRLFILLIVGYFAAMSGITAYARFRMHIFPLLLMGTTTIYNLRKKTKTNLYRLFSL